MQKKESAERKMSKIKTKKVLTPEQKKKRIRNIIIVAAFEGLALGRGGKGEI